MFNFIELQKKQIYHTVRQIIRQMTYKNMRKYRKICKNTLIFQKLQYKKNQLKPE